jgi:hypothetical protein
MLWFQRHCTGSSTVDSMRATGPATAALNLDKPTHEHEAKALLLSLGLCQRLFIILIYLFFNP